MAPRAPRWLDQLWLVVSVIVTLALLVAGLVLFIHGGDKAHVLKGLGLSRQWRQASAESLLITALIFLWLGRECIAAIRFFRRRLGLTLTERMAAVLNRGMRSLDQP